MCGKHSSSHYWSRGSRRLFIVMVKLFIEDASMLLINKHSCLAVPYLQLFCAYTVLDASFSTE